MGENKRSRDKLTQYKIGGPSKPFVDQNLQLQFPDSDSHTNKRSHSPIYSHYVGSSPSAISLQVNENEFHQAVKDAEKSFDAWKQMKKKIEEAAEKFNISSS